MMKVGRAIGIFLLIVGLILAIRLFIYLYIPPPPDFQPMPPHATMARDENSPDYTLIIISLSGSAKISDVELVIIFQENSSALRLDLEDILKEDPNEVNGSIYYYDHKNDNKLSAGDSLILKIDHDGPNLDGDNDGNYTNDGPFSDGDIIKLMHKKTDGTMCVHTINV